MSSDGNLGLHDIVALILMFLGVVLLAILLVTGAIWWATRIGELVNYGPATPERIQQLAPKEPVKPEFP